MLTWMFRDVLARIASAVRRAAPDSGGLAPLNLMTPRHALGAGALVCDADGRILLIQQTYQRPPVWLPPGGWVDRGETPREAARREVREELGISVEIGRPLAARGGGYGEVTILFEAHRLDDAALCLSDEIECVAYFPPDALPPMPEIVRSYILEAVEALRDGRPSPAGTQRW
jgi:ADP-ribose pyrophosphatase YjhB (NUDIX family)